MAIDPDVQVVIDELNLRIVTAEEVEARMDALEDRLARIEEVLNAVAAVFVPFVEASTAGTTGGST